MTKEIRRLSALILIMFLALFASTSWIQVMRADALGQHPDNRRTLYKSYEIQRGPIVIDNGTTIAFSMPSDDVFSFQRIYPDPEMWAPVTGYFNPALVSSTGIESALNADLAGTGGSAFFATIERIISGQPQHGGHAMLTLDAAGQRAAYEALAGLKGAVFAMEPATGRVLVMASTPGFDVNRLASHDSSAALAAYDELVADPDKPLYNRAIAGDLNPPGSTFKVVVAAAALASGRYTRESEFANTVGFTLPGTSTTVYNAWRGPCGEGEMANIDTALRLSCNTIFARLAIELGDDAIRQMAEKLGFTSSFSMPLESLPSEFPRALDPAQTGLAGFGQGDVRATPLHIALVSAAVANGGVVMNPRMVDAVLANDLSVLRSYENSEFGRAMSAEVAAELSAMMVDGVRNGAANGARIDGITVGGKTGTAQNGALLPYSLWFTGFAPAENPRIAIAVVVEDGGGQGQSGSSNGIASPIAKKVIEAVLNR